MILVCWNGSSGSMQSRQRNTAGKPTWCCARSVSYTHLDVYKRQAQEVQDKIKEWSRQYTGVVCYCFDSFSTLLYVLLSLIHIFYESDADRQTVYMWIARFVVTAAVR